MTVARDIMKMYYDEINKLKSVIRKERVSITTDTWTSIQNINYMCITAHWIDKDWCLQKESLTFAKSQTTREKLLARKLRLVSMIGAFLNCSPLRLTMPLPIIRLSSICKRSSLLRKMVSYLVASSYT
ncbi:Ribonuclease H-like domain containing protein [Trema orientale]|uniref:Ribonuclease H-like domain containing protein n=1 Tax=Trema orientale TaxID=63057 RepID=A0A2P5CZI5_TREOI|nr:Ribonuclease H-like domain containing protein [Trema orientale]